MEISKHYVAENGLLTFINCKYAIKGEKIRLYRKSQGRVFFIQTPSGRKVFKLYLPTVTAAAIQTTRIITYLDGCGYPIVKIIPAISGELYITVDQPEGSCVGVLFEYASGLCIWSWDDRHGHEKDYINPFTRTFSRQVGIMHRLMDHYREPIIQRGSYDSIFGVMISQLRTDNYDENKVCDLDDYAGELWAILSRCPAGFYHADMHPGNTKYRKGVFTWMDFDKACMSYNIMDFGWLLQTDWLSYDKQEESLNKSIRLFDEVYAGYGMERNLSADEINAAIHCVAIIHFESLSIDAGMYNKGYTPKLADREYNWLMRWRECCEKMNI
jgi:Ser/Thr protein kinase RdoA (MazF antagonist)